MLRFWQVAMSPDTKIVAPFKLLIARMNILTIYAPTYHFSQRRCEVCLPVGTILWASGGQGRWRGTKGVQENQDQAGMSDWQWDVTKCVCVGTFCRIWVDGQTGRRLLPLSQHDSDARLPSSNRRWRRHLSCAKHKHTEMTLSTHAWHWFPEPLNTHWFCNPCKISALSCLSTLSHEAALIFGLPDARSRR